MVDRFSESGIGDVIGRAEAPPVPAHAPALDRLLVDDVGNLWARSNPPGHPDPPTWFVFDEVGVLRHSLSTELDPVQVGDDFVLAIQRDDLGVAQVALFPLRKH